MSFIDRLFGREKHTAALAKDRLMVTLSKERTSSFPFMDDLRRDIIAVVQKYMSNADVSITTEKNHNIDTIAIDVALQK